MSFRTLDDADVKSKRVLVRVDLNVPMANGEVTDLTRIERIVPTIAELSRKGAKVILLAHFGRPKGVASDENSLKHVVKPLAKVLGHGVHFAEDCIGDKAKAAVDALKDGDVLLLENTRFHKGEEKNDPEFVAALAANGDLYVNDAFSAAHRAHASTEGLAHVLPACAGRGMQAELEALEKGLGNPARPVVAIVGGAKVSTKLDLLSNLIEKVDALVIGGGMANTFLAAKGYDVGKSLCEHELASTAREIMAKAETTKCAIILPVDAVVGWHFAADTPNQTYGVDAVPSDGMILDAGALSTDLIASAIDAAPVKTAKHVAARTKAGKLVSVGGGGDTVAALNHAGVADDFTYISTAGGAFLEWMEGKPLPGVDVLKK